MFYNLNRAKQAKALMLHLRDDKKTLLKAAEYAVLRALAERMAQKTLKPKGKRMTPTIANTCFPSLKSIARDAAMSESTASRAIDRLVKKGLIEKDVIHNFAWKGRKDYKPKHNGVRYRITAIWDEVPVVEYREDHDEADGDEQEEMTTVSAEELAEAERVLADPIDLPVATKAASATTAAKKQGNEVFEIIKYYFGQHSTIAGQTDKDGIRSMTEAIKELVTRSLALGDLNYANGFIWWLKIRRNAEFVRLMTKVERLGSKIGLLKSIVDLWDEFVPEKDDEIEELAYADQASDDYEAAEQDSAYEAYDEDDDFGQPVKPAKPATPVYTFEDEEDDIQDGAPVAQVVQVANPHKYGREIFVQALTKETNLLRRPSEGFTVELDKGVMVGMVNKWLSSVPYGRKIVHRSVSASVTRVEIKWNVARYIVAHAEQFIADGYVDELYQPVVDPEVLAEIEAEKAEAEESARVAAQKKAEEDAVAEAQRKEAAEAAHAQKDKLQKQENMRIILKSYTDPDGDFCWIAKKSEQKYIPMVREYLTSTFPTTFRVTEQTDTQLTGIVSGILLDRMQADKLWFKNVFTEADLATKAVAA